jgi:5'-nucleotidase
MLSYFLLMGGVEIVGEVTGRFEEKISEMGLIEVVRPQRQTLADPRRLDYYVRVEWGELELDSDIHALLRERIVSVSPVSLDLTSRADRRALERLLAGG